MNNLDDLLSQPLAKISNNDFTQQVIKRINNYYRWRSVVLKSLSVILLVLFLALSSPIIWLSQLGKVTDFLSLKLAYFSQFNFTLIFQQISQQPLIAIAILISLLSLFAFLEE